MWVHAGRPHPIRDEMSSLAAYLVERSCAAPSVDTPLKIFTVLISSAQMQYGGKRPVWSS